MSGADKIREWLSKPSYDLLCEDTEDGTYEKTISIAKILLDACEYVIEHELYHGVNEGVCSEESAKKAIEACAKEIEK